jgi:hypothetical protein
MKKKILNLFVALVASLFTQSQVKIGGAGNPDPGAVLDLDGGTSRGLLLPRLTNTDMLAMSAAANGMIIYNTTQAALYLRKSNTWVKLTDGSGAFSLPHVGMYNQSPGAVLELYNIGGVNGTAIIGKSNEGKGIVGISGQGTGVEGIATSGIAGYFSASNGFPAIQTGTGSVCIGTTTTTKAKLMVSGSWGAVSARFGENTWGVAIENGDPAITFNTYYIGTRKAMADGYGGYMTLSPVTGKFNIFGSTAAGTADNTLPMISRMTLTKEGHMGIGTTDPVYPLTLVSNAAGFVQKGDLVEIGTGVTSTAGIVKTYSNHALHFSTNNNPVAQMMLNTAGDIGVGTAVPVGRMHVRDDQQSVLVIENSSILDNDVTTSMYFRTGNNYSGAIATIGTASISARMGFFTDVTAAAGLLKERMSILDNGNVGINTVAPTVKLDVVGKTRVAQGAGDNAALEIAGPIMISGVNKAAFVRTVTAADVQISSYSVIIDNPICNNDPNAIIIITSRGETPVWVDYDASINKWKLYTGGFHITGHTMASVRTCGDICVTHKIPGMANNGFSSGDKFNILVIKSI